MSKHLLVITILLATILACGSTPTPQAEQPAQPQEQASQPAEAPTEAPTATPEPPTATPEPPADTPTLEPTSTPEPPTATPGPTDTPVPPTSTPAPQAFSGTGQQVAGPMTLNPGLVMVAMTHNGASNFAIQALDAQGELIDLLVNVIGSFDGSKAFSVTGGEYVLDISADGNWTVNVSQPVPSTDSPGPPHSLTGRSQQATGFIQLGAGLTTFNMTHNGERNFAILLLDQDGQLVDLIANEIGPFDGSTAVGVPESGYYLLDITADGDWAVTIEQ